MNRTDAKQAKEIANNVLANFDKLTGTYVKLFNLCYDALAPETPQAERNRVRNALKLYLATRPDNPHSE
jgi:hypothetical protein